MTANAKMLAQLLVTVLIVVLLGWLIWLVVSHPNLEPASREVLVTVLYQIVPVSTAAFGFWLGTSLSSSSKDSTIAQAIASKSSTTT